MVDLKKKKIIRITTENNGKMLYTDGNYVEKCDNVMMQKHNGPNNRLNYLAKYNLFFAVCFWSEICP